MPLRPELYARLQHTFKHVRIAYEDEEMVAVVDRLALTGKKTLQVTTAGEYYITNCPFCNDTRMRLWINYLWGYLHPATNSRNLWLCVCFNEQCLRSVARQKQLYADVFSDFGHERNDVLLPPLKPPAPPVKPRWPGQTVPLDKLRAAHPARDYLHERGYDPDLLATTLRVGLCTQTDRDFPLAEGRIIIPVFLNGRLEGWQARFVGDPIDRSIPKYVTMTGMKKTQLLYNYDVAKRYPFVCVVEGVSDVWRLGPASVALFGKTLSSTQRQLIAGTWGSGTVVILLDGDAREDAQVAFDSLNGLVRQRLLVELPDNLDPGDMAQEDLHNLIAAEAQRQGIDLLGSGTSATTPR